MSPPRGGERLLIVWALLVAVLLHLAAHVGWDGGPAGRESLYEDGPVLVANPAFEAYGTETFGDVLSRALTDPDAAWAESGGAVGRSQCRPVSRTLALAERWTFRGATAQGAAAVSLLLHLAVVLLTLRILALLDAPRAARWLAATVVAASPVALTAAAWPAHQAIVLATALGLAGVVVGLRGGAVRGLAAGVLLAAAALSHELAWGLGFALFALRARAAADDPDRTWAMRLAGLPVVAAFVFVWGPAMFTRPHADVSVAELPSRLVAIPHTLVSAVIPARLHFADGPWSPLSLVSAILVGVSVVATIVAVRRAQGGAAGLARASAAAVLPVVAAGGGGTPAGALFHDHVLYLALPFLAGAIAWGVASGLARGGGVRTAAAVAGALWIGANVAATATRAGSFRTRAGHLALALLEMPDSPIVEAWSFDAAVVAAAADAEPSVASPAAADRLRGLATRAETLGARVVAEGAPDLRRDPVAAVAVATSLTRFGNSLVRAGLPAGDPAYESAEIGCASAVFLLPEWVRGWIELANVRDRVGALQAARDAAQQAAQIAPDDPDVIATGVRTSLALGDGQVAALLADRLFRVESERARRDARRPRPDVILMCARANAAAGAARLPDPLGAPGVRARYEVALQLLRDMIRRDELAGEARRELARTCLLYGDALVSADRPALALVAYAEAERTGVRSPELTEHRRWLWESLQRELADAQKTLERAQRGDGNVADAMVGLARVFARMANWADAEKVFEQLEASQGMSPELRYFRAMSLWRDGAEDRPRAISELRQVIADSPLLARVRFELANLLAEGGDYRGALEQHREARRLGVEQAATLGAEDWLLGADAQVEFLDRLLRDQDAAK